jgi:glycerol-3-phosphate dehydrogenase (NAD(P)+)
LVPSQVVDDVFGTCAAKAACVGPSFADDVVKRQLTAVTVACADLAVYNAVTGIVANDFFKTYFSGDLIGVQITAALKNVVALAVGMLEGAGYGPNTQIMALMAALEEVKTFLAAQRCSTETLLTHAGVGDMVLTAMTSKSRNRHAGILIGQCDSIKNLEDRYETMPEGINAVVSLHQWSDRNNLVTPLFDTVYTIISQGEKVQSLIQVLSKL